MSADFIHGDYRPLAKRGIHEDTCRLFGYRVGTFKDQTVQVADYYDPSGQEVVAQKLRFKNKDFLTIGKMKKAGLFGQHVWRDSGRMVIITEGEIDALTVSQLQKNKYPVVSLKNGADSAKKAVEGAIDWLDGFEKVVLFFDNDEPGRKATEIAASILPPGKAFYARMPDFKDANEALLAGQGHKVMDAVWGAKAFRPDGIVDGRDVWDDITSDEFVETVPYPWEGLNEKTLGLRRRELITVTAGSGIGKSAIVREIGYSLIQQGETVGFLMLEESKKRTAKGLMGIHMNKPLHLDLTPFAELPETTQADYREAFQATVGSGRCFLYDHFGSTEVDNLLSRVRYLARACGCGWIILDHLSIVVSGMGDGDERRMIDNAMTALRTLVEETGVGLIVVSHLKRPEKKGHEDGAQTSLSQLRGSHAIAQLSDMVIGAERNQQGDNPNITLLRVLKNRFSGVTGPACLLGYEPDTGRLRETTTAFDDNGPDDDDEDDPF
ncbi:topoisomerase [Pyruvatibacter mobilis]|uniref:Topoisomerase n=1 Tax=Pyruvatibacter mobilis TaxID=1712261 RepID=A0A845Q7C0_9HYPH|nr:DnaB-like helicase C-terminal domain-containing protein [Pyruvatibacter mobilis]NBG94485.1 topoisomerase [Pyruvatibacter mobilis]QJD74005.1 bifunctional DNA primase/helicase [Pyruvatibacter mobilis]